MKNLDIISPFIGDLVDRARGAADTTSITSCFKMYAELMQCMRVSKSYMSES